MLEYFLLLLRMSQSRVVLRPGGPVRQPYAIVDYIPLSGTKNLAAASEKSEVLKIFHKKSRNLFRTIEEIKWCLIIHISTLHVQ